MILLQSLQDFWTYDFLLYALLGTLILAFLCGLMSPLVVAKQYAFIGESISHSTLLSLNLAWWLTSGTPFTLFLTTLGLTLLLVLVLAWSTYKNRLPSDSLIGIFLAATLSLGILVHFLFVKDKADMTSQLFGSILTIEAQDFYLLGVIALVISLGFFSRYKQWIYFFFDEEGARIQGIPVLFHHLTFFIMLTLLIVGANKIAGTILINAYLLIPGIFAYRFFRSMKNVFIGAISFSIGTSIVGLILCNYLETPPGATLALFQFILLMLSIAVHKLRKIYENKTHEPKKS